MPSIAQDMRVRIAVAGASPRAMRWLKAIFTFGIALVRTGHKDRAVTARNVTLPTTPKNMPASEMRKSNQVSVQVALQKKGQIMGDWQVGDLAFAKTHEPEDERYGFRPGMLLTVTSVMPETPTDWPSLLFSEIIDPVDFLGWKQSCFIKISPPEADAFDREVIEQMTGNPATEGV